MKRVLLTGFEPFGGETLNPSAAVVAALREAPPCAVALSTQVLPVDRFAAVAALLAQIDRERPQVVVMLGEAGGRACVTPERVAINVDDYRIADNAGHQPRAEAVVPGAAVGYFSTLPLVAIVDALQGAGIPAAISNTAGTYLCNRVFYQVMHHGAVYRLAQRAGFVHLPYLHEQAIGKPPATPSLALATLVDAARIVLQQSCAD